MFLYLVVCFLQWYLLTLLVSLLTLALQHIHHLNYRRHHHHYHLSYLVVQRGCLTDLVHNPEAKGFQPRGGPLDSSLHSGSSLAEHFRLLHELADNFLLTVNVVIVELGVNITGHGEKGQDGGASGSWTNINSQWRLVTLSDAQWHSVTLSSQIILPGSRTVALFQG